MEFKIITARDSTGIAKAGASVVVYTANTASSITIFDENDVAIPASGMQTDGKGKLGFKAPNGTYDVQITFGTATDVIENVHFYDPDDVDETARVTAAGALMDSEVTNLADVKAFDPTDYNPAGYATVAAFSAAVTGGYTADDGTIADAGPVQFVADSSASITGLPVGWSPYGGVTPEHFSAIGDGATDDHEILRKAMQWAITNSAKFTARGNYAVSDEITLTYAGDLDFDLTGATITALSGFPGSGTRMINITGGTGDETLFSWRGGKFIAGEMAAEGTLSNNDVFNISVAESATRVFLRDIYIDMSDGVNPDYRLGGGDSGILVNGYDIQLENITIIGAQDLGVYATATSSNQTEPRQSRLFASGLVGIGCRNGVFQAKRQFNLVDVTAFAKNCLYGGGFGPADTTGGDTFTVSSETGNFRIMTDGCAYSIRGQRTNGINYQISARNVGLYLAADGVTGAAEVANASGGGVTLEGCNGCTVSGAVYGVNADLVTALGVGYVPTDFVGANVTESTGSGTGAGPIYSVGNTIRLTTVDIPRPSFEDAGNSENTFIIHTIGDSEAPIVKIDSTLIVFDGGDSIHASNNGVSGAALNQLVFRDLDGSTATGQAMGRIVGQNSDGGTIDESAAIELRCATATGIGEVALQAGPRGSVADVLVARNNGNINIPSPSAPASAAATGTTGDVAWDADYIYVCTATDTWKRVAIATW